MDFVLQYLRQMFPIRKSNILTAIVQNEKVLKGSTFPLEVKIHGFTKSSSRIFGEILRLLKIDLFQEGHVYQDFRQVNPILGNLDLLLDFLRMVDHITVATSVVIPAHL